MVAQAFIPAAREAKISQDNLVRPYLKKANGSTAAASVDVLTLPLNVALWCRQLSLRMMQALAKTANPKDALLSNGC